MRRICLKRHKMLKFITAPMAGREMMSAVRCGAAGARQQLRRPPSRGMPSAGAAPHVNVFVANAIWFGVWCACFYCADPQLGCHCKSWLCLHRQPSLKGFKSQAQSRERELVPVPLTWVRLQQSGLVPLLLILGSFIFNLSIFTSARAIQVELWLI